MAAAEVAQQPGNDAVGALRLDRRAVVRAVLGAELHEQQAQEVIDLGERCHRALATAAAGALLDGDRGWNAEDGIDIGPGCRLHELPRVGVQRFQVAALTFVEQDVEGER